MMAADYRGRFAPSPTGALHFGSLLTAVASWLRARQQHGSWLLRIEDLDPPREVAGASQVIVSTLAAFGLVPDEPVCYQGGRGDAYVAALKRLVDAGHVFPCHCSRTQVAVRSGHRGRCQPRQGGTRRAAWRMLAPDRTVAVDDAVQGRFQQNLQRDIGDFVLRRSDGLWAYQLAVVVDDADQGITEIVRGADLLDSTPRQIWLQQTLGMPTPAYAHLPVLLDDTGAKLSKQSRSLPVDPTDPLPALRQALALLGIAPSHLPAGGGCERLLAAAVPVFAIDRIPRAATLCSATWNQLNKR